MKKIMMMILIMATVMLTGCATNEKDGFIINAKADTISSGEDQYAAVRPSEDNESMTSSTTSSAPTSTPTATTSIEKPALSSSTTSSTEPVTSTTSPEKPVASSSTKPVTSTSTPSTVSSANPVVSSSTSSTKPVEVPTPVHNCNRDGHVWGNSYTKLETEFTEIIEYHEVAGNGYDYDLAYRYSTREVTDWDDVFGPVHSWGDATTAVKTTGTKTITKYLHDCAECGVTKMYDSTEEITDIGTDWERVKPYSKFPIIWYDINNIR